MSWLQSLYAAHQQGQQQQMLAEAPVPRSPLAQAIMPAQPIDVPLNEIRSQLEQVNIDSGSQSPYHNNDPKGNRTAWDRYWGELARRDPQHHNTQGYPVTADRYQLRKGPR